MDEVLRKRYRGKLECWEVELVECLPPPRWLDLLALTAVMPVPSTRGEDLSSVAVDPLAARPISAFVSLGGAHHTSVESDKDRKDCIISDVRHMQAKRKAVLAMGEAVSGVPNVAKRVQTRRDFSRLLSSISLTPKTMVVIPNDNA